MTKKIIIGLLFAFIVVAIISALRFPVKKTLSADGKRESTSSFAFPGKEAPRENVAPSKKSVDVFKPMTDNGGKADAQKQRALPARPVPLPLERQSKDDYLLM